jgi:hypothetical protein
MRNRSHDLAICKLCLIRGRTVSTVTNAAATSICLIALSEPASLAAPARWAYHSSSTATANEEALLWAEWIKAPDGEMEFRISARSNASDAARACASRLTTSIPASLRGVAVTGSDPYYNLLPNSNGTGAALTVISSGGSSNSGRLVVWPTLGTATATLLFDAPGKWLSQHHIVLCGDSATVIDVRAPLQRFVFKGASARNVRASSDGQWLVIDPSGTVGIGKLDYGDPAWYSSVRYLPLGPGSVVCDATFAGEGSVVVTQESSVNGPRYIRTYRLVDGEWTKISEVPGWWYPTDTPGSIRLYENGVFMNGGMSICLANSMAPPPPFPAPYHRLRVSDAGAIDVQPWTNLGLELGADPYAVSPSGLLVAAKRRDAISGSAYCSVVRVGPILDGQVRSSPAPQTPNAEAWFCVPN